MKKTFHLAAVAVTLMLPLPAIGQFVLAPDETTLPANGLLALPMTWTAAGSPPNTVAYDVVFDPARVAIFRGESIHAPGGCAASYQRGDVRVSQVSAGRARVLSTGPTPRAGAHHILTVELLQGTEGSLALSFQNIDAFDHDPGGDPIARSVSIADFSKPIGTDGVIDIEVPTVTSAVAVRPGDLLRLNPNVLASPGGLAGRLVIEAPAGVLDALSTGERGSGTNNSLIKKTTNGTTDTINVLFSSPVDTRSALGVSDLPEIDLVVNEHASGEVDVRVALESTHTGPPHYGSLGVVETLVSLDIVSPGTVIRDLEFVEAPENGYQINDTVTFTGMIDWPEGVPASQIATSIVFDAAKIELMEVTIDADLETGGAAASTTDLATANANGKFEALWLYDGLLRNPTLKVPEDTVLVTYTVRIADASVQGRDLQWFFTARDNTEIKTTGGILADAYVFVDWTRAHRDLISIY